jgi:hypothetical protein
MKITRDKLLGLWALIERLGNEKTSVRFHYLLLKTKRCLAPEVETVQKVTTTPEGYPEFDGKRLELCNEYCEKDEDDKPILRNNNFVIKADEKEAFDESMEALKDEYSEVIKEAETRQKEFLALLNEEVEVDCPTIPMSVMPEKITGTDLELLFDLVADDAE